MVLGLKNSMLLKNLYFRSVFFFLFYPSVACLTAFPVESFDLGLGRRTLRETIWWEIQYIRGGGGGCLSAVLSCKNSIMKLFVFSIIRCPETLFISHENANFLFSAFSIIQGETKTPKIMGCCRANFRIFTCLEDGHFSWKMNIGVTVQNLTFRSPGSSYFLIHGQVVF